MIILLLFSTLSGIVTVVSPCILPVLPIVLSSSVATGKRRPLGVITGLIISFSIFTLAISKIVSLLGLSASVLRLVAVTIIGILGLTLLVPALNTVFEKLLRFLPGLVGQNDTRNFGFMGGFLTGASLGLVWAPCAGPILAAVTTLAATQSITFGSTLVVIAYAIGAGFPLLGIAYGGRALINRIPFLTRNLQKVQQTFGVVMIVTAVLIAFNVDTLVTVWVTNLVPNSWTNTLSSFENSTIVSQQIDRLQQDAGGQEPGSTSAISTTDSIDLQNLGQAPELAGISNWINSEPLTLENLKGKVVLIDFWTYSCVNCVRTLPYLTDWYNKYKDQGLVIIGVHSPEFAFEHETSNVIDATQRYGIDYPVAQDNDFITWRAYNNRYWPAEYFIDASGNIRYTHFGEGNYDKSEKIIQQLLEEAGNTVQADLTMGPENHFSSMQTPETYIGTYRQQNFASPEKVISSQPAFYSIPDNLPVHSFALEGSWEFQDEYARITKSGGKLALHFIARDVYLVMSSKQPSSVKVTLVTPEETNQSEDVGAGDTLIINGARLYHLAKLSDITEGTLLLEFKDPDVEIYAFTFGG